LSDVEVILVIDLLFVCTFALAQRAELEDTRSPPALVHAREVIDSHQYVFVVVVSVVYGLVNVYSDLVPTPHLHLTQFPILFFHEQNQRRSRDLVLSGN
jgi:hypothetical protein